MPRTVLDLFCGAGGFSQGFRAAGYDVIAGVDTDTDAIATYEANHDGQAIQQDLTELSPEAFANQYHIYPKDVDVVIGGPPCLPEGHPIITREGHKDISEVQVGDYVLTHQGRYREVTDQGGKHHDGDLVVLDLKYRPDPIKITAEHPVFTNEGWVEAGDITEEHSIKYPRRCPQTAVEHATFEYESKLNQYTTEDRELFYGTEEVYRFLGAYVAEGWRRKTEGDYEITLGVHEDDIERTQQWITDAWGEDTSTWTESTEGKGMKITFCDEGVWKFLGQFGDGAWNKRLPRWFQEIPFNWQRAFLNTYVECDGSERDNTIRYSTVSRELAYDIQQLWVDCFNTLPSLTLCEHEGHSEIYGRKVERNDIYVGSIPKSGNTRKRVVQDAAHLYLDVSDVNREGFDGMVYNLEVSGDESYCTPLAALHNCQGFSLANVERSVDDDRNNLVFVFAEYVDYYVPETFLMENVTGITSVDDGTLFETLLGDFRTSGYTVDNRVLNAADYGVPQKRKRMFVQGVRDGTLQWPEPTHAPPSELETETEAFPALSVSDD